MTFRAIALRQSERLSSLPLPRDWDTVMIYKRHLLLVKLWLYYFLLFLPFIYLFLQAPSCPPSNIRLQPLQSTNLLVRWDSLPQECQNGQLGGYKVYYRRRYYWGEQYHVTASPSDTQVMIGSLTQLAEYEVWMTAFTFKEGPKSQSQSTVIGGCICIALCAASIVIWDLTNWSQFGFLHESKWN